MAPGSFVGVLVDSPLAFARGYLAALAAGVCVAPLDPRSTVAELGRVVETLQLSDVLVEKDGEQSERLAGSGMRIWGLTGAGDVRRLAGDRRVAAAGRNGISVVLSTSGTTGRPKVVPLRERQLLHVAGGIVRHHALSPADRGYCPLPLFHINAQVVGLLSTLVAGSSLVLERRFRRASTWEAAETHGTTWLNFVPAIISTLCSEPPPPESFTRRARFARSASAPLPVPVLERFEAHTGISVLETYGLTEAASQVTANPLDPAARRPGSVGRPVGVWLRIVGEDGRIVADGDLGVVEITGPGVIETYLGSDRSPRAARDGEGWFRTGDLGRRDGDGYVYLAGRTDDMINRGGELIEPREVEEVLLADPRVAEAAVIGRPHPVLGQEPVALVRARGAAGDGQLVAELEGACERALTRYKRPVEIQLVDAFPVGATGKVSRRRLVAASYGTDPTTPEVPSGA